MHAQHSPRRNANIFPEIVCVRWKRCAISTIYRGVKWLEIVLYSKINVSRDAAKSRWKQFRRRGLSSRENDFDKTKKNTWWYLESRRALREQRSVPDDRNYSEKSGKFIRHYLHGNTPVVSCLLYFINNGDKNTLTVNGWRSRDVQDVDRKISKLVKSVMDKLTKMIFFQESRKFSNFYNWNYSCLKF